MRKRLYWGLGLLLALAGVVAAWFWQARPEPAMLATSAPIPAFEEPSSGQEMSQRLVGVDEALFQGLSHAGLPPDNLQLIIRPQKKGDLTLLSARLLPGQKPMVVAEGLLAALRGRADRVNQAPEAGGLRLEVHLGDRLTHVVSLRAMPEKLAPPPAKPPLAPPAPAPPSASERPRMAIVIDDLGYSLAAAQRLADLGLPLTFSILPGSPHALEIAQMARARGLEVVVHMPMEPRSYPHLSPGPGALLVAMDDEQLRRRTKENLDKVPGAKGVNNHMGSRFTENAQAMQPVLEVIRGRGLYFLDSATSNGSKANDLARRMGLAHGQRDIFLDHDPDPAAVRRQLERALALARGRGASGVIVIGHPGPGAISALEGSASRLRQEVDVVPASHLVHPSSTPDLDNPAGNP